MRRLIGYFAAVFVFLTFLGTIKSQTPVTTSSTCNHDDYSKCVVSMFELVLQGSIDTEARAALCDTSNEFADAKTCADNYANDCSSAETRFMTSLVHPYISLLQTIKENVCQKGLHTTECLTEKTKTCLKDFASSLTHDRLSHVCRQAESTLKCMEVALDTCEDVPRYVVAMVASQIQLTSDTVCNHDDCDIGVARQCLADTKAILDTPITLSSNSELMCSLLTPSMTCANVRLTNCQTEGVTIPSKLLVQHSTSYQTMTKVCGSLSQFTGELNIPSELLSTFYMTALSANPWMKRDMLCRQFNETLLPTSSHGDIMSMSASDIVTWEQSMDLTLNMYSDVCLPNRHLMCDWMNSSTSTPVCLPDIAKNCVDNVFMSWMVIRANLNQLSWDTVCSAASTMLGCADFYTRGCNMQEEVIHLNQTIWKLVDISNDHCSNTMPTCDLQLPQCHADLVLSHCVGEGVENICERKTEVYNCFAEHTSSCTSLQSVSAQIQLDWLLRSCDFKQTITADDHLKGFSTCNVELGHNIYLGMRHFGDFNAVLCGSLRLFYQCHSEQTTISLVRFYSMEYESFYTQIYQTYCSSNLTTSTTLSEPVATDTCSLDMASALVAVRMEQLYRLLLGPVHDWDQLCNDISDFEKNIVSVVQGCPNERIVMFQNAGLFLRSTYQTFCRKQHRGLIKTSCDTDAINTCIAEFGGYLSVASLKSDHCGHLNEAYQCIHDEIQRCDANTQNWVAQEVLVMKSMMGNITCPSMSWCQREDFSLPWVSAICSPSNQICDLDWMSCIGNTVVCSNLASVEQCVAAKLSGCDELHYLWVNTMVVMYSNQENLNCQINISYPNSYKPEYLTIIQCSLTILNAQDLSKTGLCSAIGQYQQCVADALNQSEVPIVWQGLLGRSNQLWQGRFNMACSNGSAPFPVWDQTLEPTGSTCQQQEGLFCLRSLASVSMTMIQVPLSQRQSFICSDSVQQSLCVQTSAGGCDTPTQTSLVNMAQWLLDGLDVSGICLSAKEVRQCDTNKALTCMMDVGISLIHQMEKDTVPNVCLSQNSMAECVNKATSRCDRATRSRMEKTFSNVATIVKAACSQTVAPSSPTCVQSGESTQCDMEKALVCMIPVTLKLLQTDNHMADICRAVGEMMPCIDKHTTGCDERRNAMIQKKLSSFSGYLNDQCPEIYCQACAARTCLADLQDKMRYPKENICFDIADARDRVYEYSHHCSREVSETLMSELTMLTGEHGQNCDISLPSCLQTFSNMALRIVNHGHSMGGNSDEAAQVLQRMCRKATVAKQCITHHLVNMDHNKADIINATLSVLGNVLLRACQGPSLQCYSCYNMTSNQDCNRMQTESCSQDMQMCGTVVESGLMAKGCIKPDLCTPGCTGVTCMHCCNAHLCNQPANDVITEEETCQPKNAIWCAAQLISVLSQNTSIECGVVTEAVNCVSSHASTCRTDAVASLGELARRIMSTPLIGQCLTDNSACQCGHCTSMLLLNVVSGQYHDDPHFCDVINRLYNNTVAELHSVICTESMIQSAVYNLRLAAYLTQGVCAVQPAQVDCSVNGMTYRNGTIFAAMDGCNRCACLNGFTQCTEEYCTPDQGHCMYQGIVYHNQERFHAVDGCNVCGCDSGHVYCTEIACTPDQYDCYYMGSSYRNGSLFNSTDGCNNCACYNGHVGCTNNICPKGSCTNNDVTYEHGQAFIAPESCNTCVCKNGHFKCTFLNCVPDDSDHCPAVPAGQLGICVEGCSSDQDCEGHSVCCSNGCGHTCQEPVIEGGDHCHYGDLLFATGDIFTAEDGCNTCICGNGLIGCTEKACPSHNTNCTIQEHTLSSGTVFQTPDQCNTCLCYDGHIGCTNKECISPDAGHCHYDNTTYGPGETFVATDGCNICLCNDEVVTCTKLNCPGDGGHCNYGDEVYESGDSFLATDGCNQCMCGNGIVGCTKMRCPDSNGTSCWYGNKQYRSGDAFTSTDGCNTCFCVDGSVGCTLMHCNGTDPGEDECDVRSIHQCIVRADLPNQAAMATGHHSNYMCMAARDMLRCIHPLVPSCPDGALQTIRDTIWWNLAHVKQFCNVSHIVESYLDYNSTGGDNSTIDPTDLTRCHIDQAYQCLTTSSYGDLCSMYQQMIDCVQQFTSHCMSIQRVPVQEELYRKLVAVRDYCDFQMTENPSDPFEVLTTCVQGFATDVGADMSSIVTLPGICRHATRLRRCLDASHLPPLARLYRQPIAKGLDMLMDVCEEHDQGGAGEGLVCHHCQNANSMDECDSQHLISCNKDTQMCSAVMQLDSYSGHLIVNKGCADWDWCQAWTGCNPSIHTCVFCCAGNQCNIGTNITNTSVPTTPTTAPAPETGECHQQLKVFSEILINQTLVLMNFNLLPINQREMTCQNFEGRLSNITYNIRHHCNTGLREEVEALIDWLLDWNRLVCPGDRVDDARCLEAVNCTEKLGNITQQAFCREANRSVACLESHIPYCTLPDRMSILQRSELLTDMIHTACEELVPDDREPLCIDFEHQNMSSGTCDPEQVLRCAHGVEHGLNNPFLSLDEFCGLTKRALVCIKVNSYQCSQDMTTAISHEIMDTVQLATDHCPDIWCPATGHCKVDMAVQCLAELEVVLTAWTSGHHDLDVCGNITGTYDCIMNATEGCRHDDQTAITQWFYMQVHHIYPMCLQPPENTTLCLQALEHGLVTLVQLDRLFLDRSMELLAQYIRANNISFNNSMRHSSEGELSQKGIALPGVNYYGLALPFGLNLPGVTGYAGNMTRENSTDHRGNNTTSAEGNSTTDTTPMRSWMMSGMRNGSGQNYTMGNATKGRNSSWEMEFFALISHDLRYLEHMFDEDVLEFYQSGKMELCEDLSYVWKCVDKKLKKQGHEKQDIARLIAEPIIESVHHMCENGVECYSCDGLEDDEQCNRQHLSTCGHLQMCQSRYMDGHVTKGCRPAWSCEEECRMSRGPCFCCHGNRCNVRPQREGHCDLPAAMRCSIGLLSQTMKEKHDRNLLHRGAQCIAEETKGCHGDAEVRLHIASKRVLALLEAAECSDSFGPAYCNIPALNNLVSIMQNDHRTPEAVCSAFNKTLSAHLLLEKAGACKPEDNAKTQTLLRLVHRQLSSDCVIPHIKQLYQFNVTMCNDSMSGGSTMRPGNVTNGFTTRRPGNTTTVFTGRPGNVTTGFTRGPGNTTTGFTRGPGNVTSGFTRGPGNVTTGFTRGAGNVTRGQGNATTDFTTRGPGNAVTDGRNNGENVNVPARNQSTGDNPRCSSVSEYWSDEEVVATDCQVTMVMEKCFGPLSLLSVQQRCSVSEVRRLYECVHNMTTGCLTIQKISVDVPLHYFLSTCGMPVNSTTTNRLTDDSFGPVYTCLKKMVNVGQDLCENSRQTRQCLNDNVGDLYPPQRLLMKGFMERLASSVNETGCSNDTMPIRTEPCLTPVECRTNVCRTTNVTSACPTYPKATCVASNCSSCEASFFYNGINVTDYCQAQSRCNADLLTTQLKFGVLRLSMRELYSAVDTENFCYKMSEIQTMNASIQQCLPGYRENMINLLAWIQKQTQSMCFNIQYVNAVACNNSTCNFTKAVDILDTLTPYLRGGVGNDVSICQRVKAVFTGQLHCTLSNCTMAMMEDMLQALNFSMSLIMDRCPDLIQNMYCHGNLPVFGSQNNVSMTTVAPTGRTTPTAGPESNRTGSGRSRRQANNSICSLDRAKSCLFYFSFPTRNQSNFCGAMRDEVDQLGMCVSRFLVGCDITDLHVIREYYGNVSILREASTICIADLVSSMFTDGHSQRSCSTVLPRCSLRQAHGCLQNINASSRSCGNVSNVTHCITMATRGCNDLQRFPVVYVLRQMLEYKKVPVRCMGGDVNTPITGPYAGLLSCVTSYLDTVTRSMTANQIGGGSDCSVIRNFQLCLRREMMSSEVPAVARQLMSAMLLQLTPTQETLCNNPVEGSIRTINDSRTCDVNAANLCLNSFSVNVILSVTMTTEDKRIVCNSLEPSLHCIRQATVGCHEARTKLFLEFYDMMVLLLQLSETCSTHSPACLAQEAVQCIAEVGGAISDFKIFSDKSRVCRTFSKGKNCIRKAVLNCDDATKASIMRTWQPISCRAETLCPMEIEEVSMETVPSCIDPLDVQEDRHCNLHMAMACLLEFHYISIDPFNDLHTICMSYSRTLTCYFENTRSCENNIVSQYIAAYQQFASMYIDSLSLCPTVVKPHCHIEPVPGCDLIQAEAACMRQVDSEELQCHLDASRDACINHYTYKCPAGIQPYLRAKFIDQIVSTKPHCNTLTQCIFSYNLYVDWMHDKFAQLEENRAESDNQSVMEDMQQICMAKTEKFNCITSNLLELPEDVGHVVFKVFDQYNNMFTDTCTKIQGFPSSCQGCDYNCSICYNASSTHVRDAVQLLLTFAQNSTVGSNRTVARNISEQFCNLYNSSMTGFQEFVSNGSHCNAEGIEWTWHRDLAFSLVSLNNRYCVAPCKQTEADTCLTNYFDGMAGDSYQEDCLLYNTTIECLNGTLLNCPDNIRTDYINQVESNFTSLDIICYSLPEVNVRFSSQTDENSIFIGEGEKSYGIDLTLTLPPSHGCKGTACSLEISSEIVGASSKCTDGSWVPRLLLQSCSQQFTSENWNTVHSSMVIPRVSHIVSPALNASMLMSARLYSAEEELVAEQQLRSLGVIVQETNQTGICFSNDFYLTTFDGLAYSNFLQGEFVLYQHKTLPFKVHVGLQPCNKMISCTCIVMIQSADDTFVIDRCRRQSGFRPQELKVYQNQELAGGTRVYKKRGGRDYQIVFPHGTVVIVKTKRYTVDTWIVPSPLDYNQTEGLCGTYNGQVEDDFTVEDGTVYDLTTVPYWSGGRSEEQIYLPVPFAFLWSRVSSSLYFGVPENTEQTSLQTTACHCSGTQCIPTPIVETCSLPLGKEITSKLDKYQMNTVAINRRKRQTDPGIWGEIEWNSSNETTDALPSWPTAGGYTEASAQTYCETNLVNTKLGQVCAVAVNMDEELSTCMTDILMTDSEDSLVNQLEDLKVTCKIAVLGDTSLTYTVDQTWEDLVVYLFTLTCPANCSGNGDCDDDICKCNSGYQGEDCSATIETAPTVTSLDSALYQVTMDTPVSVTIEVNGEGFLDLSSLMCHYEQVEIDDIRYKGTGQMTTSSATYISYNRVQCQLTGTLPLSAVLLSVSNNGQNQSTEVLHIIQDPVCYNCDVSSGTCIMQPTSCVVDGKCFAAGAINPADSCYICSPLTNIFEYKTSAACPASTTASTTSSTTTTVSSTTTTPSTTPATPSTTQATPSTTQATPSTTQATPSTTQVTPSTTQATPSTTQATPSTTQATPSTTQATPSTTQATPSTTQTTPSTSQTPSTQSTTKSGGIGGTDNQNGANNNNSETSSPLTIVIIVAVAACVIVASGVVCFAIYYKRNQDTPSPTKGHRQEPNVEAGSFDSPRKLSNPAFEDVTYDNAQGVSQGASRCAPFNTEGLGGEPEFVGPQDPRQDDGLHTVNMDMFGDPNLHESASEPQPSGSEPYPDYATVDKTYREGRRTDDVPGVYDNAGFSRVSSDPHGQPPLPPPPTHGPTQGEIPTPDYDTDVESTHM